jgi:hypothetical protein
MNEDSSILQLCQPDKIDDLMIALLPSGGHRLLEQATEAEVEASVASKRDLKLANGQDRLVRRSESTS